MIDGVLILIVLGLINGLCISFLTEIKPFETLKWSWQEARSNFFLSLFTGLAAGLISGLVFRLLSGLNNELFFGMSSGLFFGMISVIINGLGGSEIQQRNQPNQGIFSSIQNSVIIGTTILLVGTLIFGIISGIISRPIFGTNSSLTFGLLNGLIFGMIFGGNACLQHFVLRLILYHNKYVPWNYARFLDSAAEQLFLQKVGGGYIFVHRMVLEHFAGMSSEQGNQ